MEKISDIIIEYEKKILYYILKDIRYLTRIFSGNKIKPDSFKDPDIRFIVDAALSNYRQNQTRLVKEELVAFLNAKIATKSITNDRFINILQVLNDVITDEEFTSLKEEQFNRIFNSWLNIEAAPQVRKIIQNNMSSINDFRGIEAISNMQIEFDKIAKPDEHYDAVESIDLLQDVDRQYIDIKDRTDHDKFKNKTVLSGIKKIDDVFNGMEKESGSLTIFIGLIGHGKSTLMMNFSRHQLYAGKKVMIVTLEMPAIQWVRRFNCMDFKMSYTDIIRGDLSDKQLNQTRSKLETRRKDLTGGYKVLFMPSGIYSWKDIVLEVDKRFPGYNPDVWYIDQLSLISTKDYADERRDNALGYITRDIHSFGQRRRIAMGLAAQANRASIVRAKNGKREIDINIENVEDSNKVGAYAENVIAIHKMDDEKALIKIVKQREGESKSVVLRQNLDYATYLDDEDPGFVKVEKTSSIISTDSGLDEIGEEIDPTKDFGEGLDGLLGVPKKEEDKGKIIKDEKTEEKSLDDILFEVSLKETKKEEQEDNQNKEILENQEDVVSGGINRLKKLESDLSNSTRSSFGGLGNV
jgi:replicative DNA helicase